MSETISPVKTNSPFPAASPLPRPMETEVDYKCANPAKNFTATLNIAPPLTCREISPVPAAFVELGSAQAEYDQATGLAAKEGKKQPLTKKEQKIVDRLGTARDKMVELGVALFKAALISEQPSAAAVRVWQEFQAQAKKIDVPLIHTLVLLALADPRLNRADRNLLFSFVTGDHREPSPELVARFRHHFRQKSLDYNGWQGANYASEHTQFLAVLAKFYDSSFDRFQAALIARAPLNYLTSLSRPEAKYYLHCRRSVLRQKYADLSGNLGLTPPGSQQRIALHRATGDLWTIALARGISSDELSSPASRGDEPPPLTEEENQTFNQIEFRAGLAAGRRDSPYTKEFKQEFEVLARKYLTEKDSLKKRNYTYYLNLFDVLAVQYGVRGAELEAILAKVCRDVKCDLNGKESVKSMSELATIKSASVSPDGLPQEIKEILAATGYWRSVKENINLIVFTTDIPNEVKVAGTTTPLLRQVEIDFDGLKGKLMAPWQIAMALVHEAAHIAWRDQPAIMQDYRNYTPSERHAYAVELAFLKKCFEHYGTLKNDKEFNYQLLGVEQIVRVANEILGYAPDNFSADEVSLPGDQLLRQRGLSSADELDLTYYPIGPQLSFLAGANDFANLTNEFYPEFDRATAALLWEVLSGQADLTVSGEVRDNSITNKSKLTLNRLAGQLELTAFQVAQITEFIDRLPSNSRDKNVANELVFPVSTLKGRTTYRISYRSLRTKLFEASLTARIEAENIGR